MGSSSAPLLQFDRQGEQQKTPGLAVRIQVQGFVDAALQGLLHDEVERAQVVDAVAPHRPLQQRPEALLQRSGVSWRLTAGKWRGSLDEHADAGDVALVAGAGGRDFANGRSTPRLPAVFGQYGRQHRNAPSQARRRQARLAENEPCLSPAGLGRVVQRRDGIKADPG